VGITGTQAPPFSALLVILLVLRVLVAAGSLALDLLVISWWCPPTTGSVSTATSESDAAPNCPLKLTRVFLRRQRDLAAAIGAGPLNYCHGHIGGGTVSRRCVLVLVLAWICAVIAQWSMPLKDH